MIYEYVLEYTLLNKVCMHAFLITLLLLYCFKQTIVLLAYSVINVPYSEDNYITFMTPLLPIQ